MESKEDKSKPVKIDIFDDEVKDVIEREDRVELYDY